jgi:hypothetical protein
VFDREFFRLVLDLIGTLDGGGRDSKSLLASYKRKLFRNNHLDVSLLCSGGDLNPHALRHTPLKRTCLPFHHPSDSEERNLYHGRCSSQVFLGRNQPLARRSGGSRTSFLRASAFGYDGGITAILIPFLDQACSKTFGQSSSANSSVTISLTLILPLSR